MQKIIFMTYGLAFLSVMCGANTVQADIITVSKVGELVVAVKSSQPGDIIELVDGVYQLNTGNGIVIRDKSDLTIRSQSGNRDAVILQGSGINDTSVSFIFKLYNSLHFTLQDLTMKDVYWHHIQINDGSSYFILRNLVMLDAGEAAVKVTSPGGNGPFSDYGKIEGCWIGFTEYGPRSAVEGIDIIASVGTIIRNNEFYRIRTNKGIQSVGWGVFAKCNAQDTVIENNYFEDNDIPISFGNGYCPEANARYGDTTYQHRGGIIRNNVVNRTKDTAIYIRSANNFKIYNNTLWSTFKAGKSTIDIRFKSNGDIRNNLCSQRYRLRDGGTANFAANIWFSDAALFADQSSGDFHLVPEATKAIDQGRDTSADVPYDMDWQARPIGLAVDIGADEYVCTNADGGRSDSSHMMRGHGGLKPQLTHP